MANPAKPTAQSAPKTTTVKALPPTVNKVASSPETKKPQGFVEQKKTHVRFRLNYTIKARLAEKNSSSELIPLYQDFKVMRHKLMALIASAKNYQNAMKGADKARNEVVVQMATLSEGSPIADLVGAKNPNTDDSFASLHDRMATIDHAAAFGAEIVSYAVEWEAIVTRRVENQMAVVEKVNDNLEHYKNKIDKLRKQVSDKEARNKEIPKNMGEKLARNELKLKQAWKASEDEEVSACLLLDEIVRMGWKDLHPLVNKMMNFELKRNSGENEIFEKIRNVQSKLNEVIEAKDTPLPSEALQGTDDDITSVNSHSVDTK